MTNLLNSNKAKSSIRTILRAMAWKAQSIAVSAVKYVPYEPDLDSYVISKSDEKLRETENFAIPPESLRFGYEQTESFLSTGEKHTSKMLEIANASGFSLTKGMRILDLGCCTGRMIRHLEPYSKDCEIWGTDIDARAIYWCKANMSLLSPFRFATTTTIPHLPFEDQYFDFIYTGSVLTHIDDLADAWLLEIRRILKPSGRFYITIHDKNTVNLFDTVMKDCELAIRLRTFDLYREHKDDFNLLVLGRDTVSQVFYDIDYFRNLIDPTYEILSINPEAYGFQTALLLKRK